MKSATLKGYELLRHLAKQKRVADQELENAVKKQFPVDSILYFKFRHKQVSASVGTVIGYYREDIKVRMHTPKQKVRTVPFEQCCASW